LVSLVAPFRVIQKLDLRCYSCSVLLPLIPDGNYYLRCPSCGHAHDCKPRNVHRPPPLPTHKVISRLNPNGHVSRRRVLVSAVDSQLDLFGGIL
jgi:hypothetical protein